MKVVFAGTPEFAAVALRALFAAGHEVVLVLTQPDRAAGRGMSLQPSPVKKLAQELGLPVFQPVSLREGVALEILRATKPDVLLVAAYGLILPQAVLDLPQFGCLNIHASLLPRWRGAAPIQRAILAGDRETGVCIMQMESGLDTGPVLARAVTKIADDDTAGTLHDRLAEMGAQLAVDVLARLPLVAEAQDSNGVTYAAKIEKSEACLDWRLSASELDRRVRAFNPFPGAQTGWSGSVLKIWQARPVEGGDGAPGTILAFDKSGILVACGTGALRVLELQKAGGKRLTAERFLTGHALQVGQVLSPPDSGQGARVAA